MHAVFMQRPSFLLAVDLASSGVGWHGSVGVHGMRAVVGSRAMVAM